MRRNSLFSLLVAAALAAPPMLSAQRPSAPPGNQPTPAPRLGPSGPAQGAPPGPAAPYNPAQVAPGQMSPQQAKLMARRAATLDAQRQLAEMIYGVRIDSYTSVRDFVTESDEISSRLSALLKGAEVVATRELPDGIVEVDMVIPVYRVQQCLGRTVPYRSDEFFATGTGAPNAAAEELEPLPADLGPDYDYRLLTIQATGTGAPPAAAAGTPQGRALARRAAQLDAYRNLGENIMGVRIDSTTRVRDFVTVSDDISSRFEGFLRGAQVISVRDDADGIVEVTMQVALNDLGEIVLAGQQWHQQQAAPPAPAGATGSGLTPPANRPPGGY